MEVPVLCAFDLYFQDFWIRSWKTSHAVSFKVEAASGTESPRGGPHHHLQLRAGAANASETSAVLQVDCRGKKARGLHLPLLQNGGFANAR